MADKLRLETYPNGSTLVFTAEVAESEVLPPAIFIYENTGTATLGKYIGVCNLSELGRFQEWAGTPIAKFGNDYVRTRQAKIALPLGDTEALAKVKNNLVSTAKALRNEIQNSATSATVVSLT